MLGMTGASLAMLGRLRAADLHVLEHRQLDVSVAGRDRGCREGLVDRAEQGGVGREILRDALRGVELVRHVRGPE